MMLEPFSWPATGPTASVRVSNNRAVQSNEQHSGPGVRAVPAAITDSPAAESLASGVVPTAGTERMWTESRDQAVLAQERQLHN